MNLFSSFNPASSLMNMNWGIMWIPLLWVPSTFFTSPSRFKVATLMIGKIISSEISPVVSKLKSESMNLFLLVIFYYLSVVNLMGLLPYVFTLTSHMCVNLTFGFSMWVSMMLYGWFNSPLNFTAHMLPQGTPFSLMSVMIVIEMISQLIRPITLSVRLTANLVAGHLLIILLSSAMALTSNLSYALMIMAELTLLILEGAVALIQAYVFVILISLYLSEINYV